MLKQKVFRAARLTEDAMRRLLRLNQSDKRIEADAQAFWSQPIGDGNSFWFHARKSVTFANADEQWLSMGARHLALFSDLVRLTDTKRPVKRIVDWGCGGGANAVVFRNECEEMWGVDVSADALAECGRQLQDGSTSCRFHPVQIDVSKPEAVLSSISGEVDLFHSYYVFEVFPSQAYGARILRVALDLLRPGGLCIIQIKYQSADWRTKARRWAYRRGVANMTTYRVEEFWEAVAAIGFKPLSVVLVPKPAEVPDVRYAYFLLQKPTTSTAEVRRD